MFLDYILSGLLNKKNNFKKINTNIFNIIYNFCNDYLNDKIEKLSTNVFYLNKLKFCTFYENQLKALKKEGNNLNIINKLFEGSNSPIYDDSFHYKFGILSYTTGDNDYCILHTVNKNYNNIEFICQDNKNVHKPGYVLFPLTFGNYSDYNNFIYSIYKYLYIKNNNSYRSCFISLFYYYIGLLFSLLLAYKGDNIEVLYSNICVIVSRLSSFVFVTNFNYSNIYINNICSIKLINIINNSLYLSNLEICNYRPYLIGLTKYVLTSTGIFAKLGFEQTLRTLKSLVLEPKIDWNVDTKSNIILADFIPVGSGWYRYFIN